MISKEDIKRLRNQKYASQKDATLEDTPLTYQKNDTYRNTHHTRQGGRTDHSTSSHGPDPVKHRQSDGNSEGFVNRDMGIFGYCPR